MNKIYSLDKNLSINESMVLWRDGLLSRQYTNNKRHKYGVKLYSLTEPDGIVLEFNIYTPILDDNGVNGHAAKIVVEKT